MEDQRRGPRRGRRARMNEFAPFEKKTCTDAAETNDLVLYICFAFFFLLAEEEKKEKRRRET